MLFYLFQIYFCVLLFDIFNGCSLVQLKKLMKEINSLISKVMCDILFDVFNGRSLVQLKK